MWLRILIVAAVLYVAWLLLRRRSDFRIRITLGRTAVSGRLSKAQQSKIRGYFDETKLSAPAVKITGRWDDQGRLKLQFRGTLSKGEQQMIRNYLDSIV